MSKGQRRALKEDDVPYPQITLAMDPSAIQLNAPEVSDRVSVIVNAKLPHGEAAMADLLWMVVSQYGRVKRVVPMADATCTPAKLSDSVLDVGGAILIPSSALTCSPPHRQVLFARPVRRLNLRDVLGSPQSHSESQSQLCARTTGVVGSAPYVEPSVENAKRNIDLIFELAKSKAAHIDGANACNEKEGW